MTYDDKKINDEDNINDINYDEYGLDENKDNNLLFEISKIIIKSIDDIATNL